MSDKDTKQAPKKGKWGNPNNLKVLTSEQAKEIGRRGGLASVKARRKAKSLKDITNMLLNSACNNSKMVTEVRKHHPELSRKDVTNAVALVHAQIAEAAKGSHKHFVVVRDTSGQKPVEEKKVEGVTTLVWDDSPQQPAAPEEDTDTLDAEYIEYGSDEEEDTITLIPEVEELI